MDRYVDRVLDYGFGKVTTTAKCLAAPVLVAKAPPANFRVTFDYRPVNAVTVPLTWPIAQIDSELCDMAGSFYFAIIDFVSVYWQLPLAEESQELLSFISCKHFVQPTRCTQGAKNAGANFQSKIEPLFTNIREHIKAWLDDFVLHCRTEEGLIDTFLQFFINCREANLKIGQPRRFKFGDCAQNSKGTLDFRIPVGQNYFVSIVANVLDIDVLLLLGLDILES